MTPRPPLFPPERKRAIVCDCGPRAYGHESPPFRTLRARIGHKVIHRGTAHIDLDVDCVDVRSRVRRALFAPETPT